MEYASEFRHRNTPMTRDTVVFAISQSGETADTLGALRESRRKGYRTLGICNNVASTIARESDGGVYMHAGPEIGVAATKSFTSQVAFDRDRLLLAYAPSLDFREPELSKRSKPCRLRSRKCSNSAIRSRQCQKIPSPA